MLYTSNPPSFGVLVYIIVEQLEAALEEFQSMKEVLTGEESESKSWEAQ